MNKVEVMMCEPQHSLRSEYDSSGDHHHVPDLMESSVSSASSSRSDGSGLDHQRCRTSPATVSGPTIPSLAETLADIKRRKEEELEKIELEKIAKMKAIRQEVEEEIDDPTNELFEEVKEQIKHLKRETEHYNNEHSTWKRECRALKKANKQLIKDGKTVELAMIEDTVDQLKQHVVQREELVDSLLGNIEMYQEKIKEADEATHRESRHTTRLKGCFSDIIAAVEQKSASLTKKIWKVIEKNNLEARLSTAPEPCD